jgi:hypothetical protein
VRGWHFIILGFGAVLGGAYFSALRADCLPAWDLAIYAQALERITFADANPFLSVRNLRIFNDHFDPILLLMAGLTRWVSPAGLALGLEWAFTLAAAAGVAVLVSRSAPRESAGMRAAWGAAFVLFSRATLNALAFPAHPTTWALLPLVGLAVAWTRGSVRGVALSLAVLLLFKEDFAFAGLGAALAWALQKRGRLALTFGAAGGLAVLLVFPLREALVGEGVNYGSFLARYVSDPGPSLWNALTRASLWGDLLRYAAPFLPLWIWAAVRGLLPHLGFGLFFTLAPLLLIRVLAEKTGFHHGSVIGVAFLGLSLPLLVRRERLPRGVLVASVVLLLLPALSVARTFFVPALRGQMNHCPADPGRLQELAQARARLAQAFQPGAYLWANGNLVPGLLAVWPGELGLIGIDSAAAAQAQEVWVLRELRAGDFWPVGREGAEAWVRDRLSGLASETVLRGEWVELTRYPGASGTIDGVE